MNSRIGYPISGFQDRHVRPLRHPSTPGRSTLSVRSVRLSEFHPYRAARQSGWSPSHPVVGNFQEWRRGFFPPPTRIRSVYERIQACYLSFRPLPGSECLPAALGTLRNCCRRKFRETSAAMVTILQCRRSSLQKTPYPLCTV